MGAGLDPAQVARVGTKFDFVLDAVPRDVKRKNMGPLVTDISRLGPAGGPNFRPTSGRCGPLGLKVVIAEEGKRGLAQRGGNAQGFGIIPAAWMAEPADVF